MGRMDKVDLDRRGILGCGAAAAAALSLPRAARAADQSAPATGAATAIDLVHPDLRAALPEIEAFTRRPPPNPADLAKARNAPAILSRQPRPDVPYEARTAPGRDGNPPVVIYVVNARPGASRPAILHTHGGGYVSGSAKASVPDLQDICHDLDCVAVSVEYRLAPETTYKGSIEDNYAGLEWLHANAADLGADPRRIALLGESAGGGHAAILAITARDRGRVPLVFQCLLYPMLDDRTGTSRPEPPSIGKLVWTATNNRFGWTSFLGMAPGGGGVPVQAVPARTLDLRGLPPTFIGVGSIDLFVDEDVEYARRLLDVGVPVELLVVPGAFHGFDVLVRTAGVSRAFTATKLTALRRGFGLPA